MADVGKVASELSTVDRSAFGTIAVGNVAASVLVCAAAERLICDCTTWSAAPLWEVVMPVFSADI
jgi:hypothetical protein